MTPRARGVSHAIEVVAADFNLKPEELLDHNRMEPVTSIRMIAMCVARHATGMSTPILARIFGRDATSIHNGVSQIRKRALDNDWHRDRVGKLILKVMADLGVEPEVSFGRLPSVQLLQHRSLSATPWLVEASGEGGSK